MSTTTPAMSIDEAHALFKEVRHFAAMARATAEIWKAGEPGDITTNAALEDYNMHVEKLVEALSKLADGRILEMISDIIEPEMMIFFRGCMAGADMAGADMAASGRRGRVRR